MFQSNWGRYHSWSQVRKTEGMMFCVILLVYVVFQLFHLLILASFMKTTPTTRCFFPYNAFLQLFLFFCCH